MNQSPEQAAAALREFDAATNAYCVERGEQRLDLVRAYHAAKEAAEKPKETTDARDPEAT